MLLFNAFSGVFTVFLVAFLGFLLRRKGWINHETVAVLPRFITLVVLPPFLLRSITSGFEREQLLSLLSGAIVPMTSFFACFALAVILARLLKIRVGRRGGFAMAFVSSNSLNVGLPVNIALFGEGAIPYILVFFIAGDIFFWTVGNYCIARDAEHAHVSLFSRQNLKRVVSPPLIGFFLGMALVLLDLQPPVFLDKAFKYVGEMAVALLLIYIGIIIGEINVKDLSPDRDVIVALVGKLVLCPLVVLGFAQVFSLPEMMRNVFVIQAGMPVMLTATILTGYYKGDSSFMTLTAAISMLAIIVTTPFWAFCLGYL